MNAKVKLLITLAFIICLNLTPIGSWYCFILYFSLVISVIILSHISIGFILKRSLLVLPFVLAVIPIIFSPSTSNMELALSSELRLQISLSGIERFFTITLKTWLSMQVALIFISVTPVPDILVEMRGLGVPYIVTSLIGLMWRYLFLFRDEAEHLLRARESRSSINPRIMERKVGGSILWRGRVAGGMAGNLLLRGLERGERVYAAMLARGYNGDPLFAKTHPLTFFEKEILLICLALLFLILLLGMVTIGL